MKRPNPLVSLAWGLNSTAWFLPVVTGVGGAKLGPFVGWQTFIAAASETVPSQRLYTGYGVLLAILSALTALSFVVGSPWVVLCGARSLQRWSAWVAGAAFLLNAHWYIRLKPDGWISSLGVAYYVWWSSFAVLAIGLFWAGGRSNAASASQTQTALLPR
jgi:hypothetical protein